jgi:hypothetical protein
VERKGLVLIPSRAGRATTGFAVEVMEALSRGLTCNSIGLRKPVGMRMQRVG